MNKREVCARSFVLLSVFSGGGAALQASVVWYINDYDGWAAAAGEVHTIDFETLPNGLPSNAGTLITPSFNYTDQGVIFSSPVTIPRIAGNDESGFELDVDSSPNLDLNWIIGDLVAPARAVAVTSVSYTNLALYDAMGALIGQGQALGSGGNILFLGAVSDVPIELATSGRNSTHHVIGDFYYSPVPEPASLTLLAACLCALNAVRARHESTRDKRIP